DPIVLRRKLFVTPLRQSSQVDRSRDHWTRGTDDRTITGKRIIAQWTAFTGAVGGWDGAGGAGGGLARRCPGEARLRLRGRDPRGDRRLHGPADRQPAGHAS